MAIYSKSTTGHENEPDVLATNEFVRFWALGSEEIPVQVTAVRHPEVVLQAEPLVPDLRLDEADYSNPAPLTLIYEWANKGLEH